ncbi:hypothetical protein HY385_02300 [Candidatus Daviesbacteria bacterium]|nr:hypothetical protein [Candidatus Daviesbacteria bacterium]
MINRNKLFWLVLIVVFLTAWTVIKTNKRPVYKKGNSTVYDNAVMAAFALYKKGVKEGIKMDNGPCLTNDLMPGWVVDVIHNPRQTVDNLVENQCQAYLEGRATHFVELDTTGNLVRVQ